jgi:hypothetical protein
MRSMVAAYPPTAPSASVSARPDQVQVAAGGAAGAGGPGAAPTPAAAPQPHGGLAAGQPARGHDQHAVVIGRGDRPVAVGPDHGAGGRDDLVPDEALGELEAVGLDRDGLGHLDHALRRRRAGRHVLQRVGVEQIEMLEEAQRCLERDRGARGLPMLAAFDQQRRLVARLVGERAIVAHAPPGGVAAIHHDGLRHPHREREVAPFPHRTAQPERRRRVLHRVDVEQEIDAVDQRPQLASPGQLRRLARPFERARVPQPVEVLIDEARRVGLARIEALEGGHVGEAQGQHAAGRSDCVLEQKIEHDRAADLVAVGQRVHQDVGAGPAAVEAGDVRDLGVAGVAGDVRRRQHDGVG